MLVLIANASSTDRYLEEILTEAGFRWSGTSIRDADASSFIVIGANVHLDREARDRIADLVQTGASVILIGGTHGLDAIAGASDGDDLAEGYAVSHADHPVIRGLRDPLHVFHARALRTTAGKPLGELVERPGSASMGASVVINACGRGRVVTIAADIAYTVWLMQSGTPVLTDGVPAPDGSAPYDDDILKAEDGMVLDWEHDRDQTMPAEGAPHCIGFDDNYPAGDTPWFATPIADEARLLLLQALAWCATDAQSPLARVAPWPHGLEAVAMMSHDSDLNEDAAALKTLDLLRQHDVRSTWCHMFGNYPDVYEAWTFPRIRDAGHEIALHYNALPKDGGHWSKDEFHRQAAFIRKEAGVDGFVSNKNHYTRWEGQFEFFHWLLDEGIQLDQSRGPSKKGNVGYPLGTSLPSLPLDVDGWAFLDVLELPMQFQDLALTTPTYMAGTTIAQAIRQGGVAHFLFHQHHLFTRDDVVEAFADVIPLARTRGLDWWRSEDINHWVRARRQIRIGMSLGRVSVSVPSGLRGVNVEVFGLGESGENSSTRWNAPVARVDGPSSIVPVWDET